MFFPGPIFRIWVWFLWDFPLSYHQDITIWVGRYTNRKLLPSSNPFASWSLLASSPMVCYCIPFRSGFILTAVTSGSSARGHHYYGFIRLLAPHLVWLGFPHHTLVGQTHLRVLYFYRPRTIPDLPRSASLPFTAVLTPTTWYIIAHSGFPRNPQGRRQIPCRIELTCVSDRLFANSVLHAPFTGPRYSFASLLNGSRREGFTPSGTLTFKAHG